jgi:hypothetical protein
MAALKEAMGSQMDSKEGIAKQTEDKMKESLDMELIGDNPLAKTIRGHSRHSGIVPKELEQ